MEEEFNFTPFDQQLTTKNVQILKTIVPYFDASAQRALALMIQFLEFQKTTRIFNGKAPAIQTCSITDPQERMTQMLNDIKIYCSKTEQDNIDQAINTLQMLSAYDLFFHTT